MVLSSALDVRTESHWSKPSRCRFCFPMQKSLLRGASHSVRGLTPFPSSVSLAELSVFTAPRCGSQMMTKTYNPG